VPFAGAIEKFEGGVVIISHNDEFCQQLHPPIEDDSN